MTDTDLDDAIDRAVREMMSVDGSSVTGARLFASVERPVRRLTPWMWAAAAATVALVLAILVMRAPRHETSPGIAPERGAPQVLRPDERSPAPSDSQQASRPAPIDVRRALERTVAGTRAPVLPETIPALVEIDPLVVPTPRVREIEPEEVVIPPLADITEIEFGPLGFPQGPRD